MFKAYVKGAIVVLSRPWILLVPVFCTLIAVAGFYVFGSILADAFAAILSGEIPQVPILDWPAYLWGMYPQAILALGVAALWFVLLQLFLGFWISDYIGQISMKKKASLAESGIRALAQTPHFVYITITIAILAMAAIALLMLVSAWALANPILSALLLLLMIGGFVFLMVKFSFVIPALVAEKGHLTEALRTSYEFSNKSFFTVLVFVFILGLLGQLWSLVGTTILDLFALEDWSILLAVFFFGAGSLWVTSSSAFWFFEKPARN